MNANELADIVDKWAYKESAEYLTDAANMLRQQKAELDALKKEAALQRLSDFTQDAESFDRTASHMAGEYVSYPVKEVAGFFGASEPVYPTAKELTVTLDDCIAASLEQDVGYGGDLDLLEFARAILRKAQEK